jgi:hypothetical protein
MMDSRGNLPFLARAHIFWCLRAGADVKPMR